MSDELREKVAMVNCAGNQWDKPCKVPCVDCLREADAAIALVRAEQAARIEQLEAALRGLVDIEDGPGMGVTGWSDAMDRARVALGESK